MMRASADDVGRLKKRDRKRETERKIIIILGLKLIYVRVNFLVFYIINILIAALRLKD